MKRESDSSPGSSTRWQAWRERRRRAARERNAWAEERLNSLNQERYRAWGRSGGNTGPDVGGGGDGGGGG
jgi:hypothetical protein